MVGYNFGPPAIDFSPLGRLGETYDRSVKRAHEAEVLANRERALATFGQNSDLSALGQTLLRAGDLEGGMSALRLAAANEGTPWQKQRAAAEDARYTEAQRIAGEQREKEERRHTETLERADRPVRVTEPGVNEFGDATRRQGWQYPNGVIKWEDGTETRAAPGPQSGGPGDPNLPAPLAAIAQSQPFATKDTPITDTGQPEYGYAIPGTGQRFPHGTILPPKGDTATAVQAPQAPLVRPGASDVPAQGAQPQAALAAPAGQVAVAAPETPPATPAAPLTATQINRGTANIAPMTNAEMIAEARRIGIRPGEYRAAREAAIKKELTAKLEGGGSLTKEQADARSAAGKMQGAETEYRPNEGETLSMWERFKGAAAPNLAGYTTSEKFQAGEAAKKEWIAGLLRKESGAAVTQQEFEYYNDIYFPSLGQGGNVAAQKARARERALEATKAGLPPDQVVKLSGSVPGAAPGKTGDLESGQPQGPQKPAETRKTSTGVGWSF